MKHGAKVEYKRCSSDGCTNLAQKGGVCIKHGATVKRKKRCSHDGCTKQAKNGGLCMKHGAKVKRCSIEECKSYAQNGGLCMKHGAKVKQCSKDGCTKQARNGGLCRKHGAKVKQCSSAGCENNALRGGKCWTHGDKPKCSTSGCQNYAVKRGVCIRHGAKDLLKKCRNENCSNVAWRGGFCYRHRRDKSADTAEGGAVSVPALPPLELHPNEPHCEVCFDTYSVDDLVKCASDSACTYAICHGCLVTMFTCPYRFVNGQPIEYDGSKCPACRAEGAFSLNEIQNVLCDKIDDLYVRRDEVQNMIEKEKASRERCCVAEEDYFTTSERICRLERRQNILEEQLYEQSSSTTSLDNNLLLGDVQPKSTEIPCENISDSSASKSLVQSQANRHLNSILPNVPTTDVASLSTAGKDEHASRDQGAIQQAPEWVHSAVIEELKSKFTQ